MKFSSPSSAEAVIAVSRRSRHFGAKAALDNVSVFIPRGSVLGLVPTLDEILVARAGGKGT
jgi:ABC-type uncharacterized transport system ATPase subunit